MIEIIETLDLDFQLTIPDEVMQKLGLTPIDEVVFVIQDDGQVFLKKAGQSQRTMNHPVQPARSASEIP